MPLRPVCGEFGKADVPVWAISVCLSSIKALYSLRPAGVIACARLEKALFVSLVMPLGAWLAATNPQEAEHCSVTKLT